MAVVTFGLQYIKDMERERQAEADEAREFFQYRSEGIVLEVLEAMKRRWDEAVKQANAEARRLKTARADLLRLIYPTVFVEGMCLISLAAGEHFRAAYPSVVVKGGLITIAVAAIALLICYVGVIWVLLAEADPG